MFACLLCGKGHDKGCRWTDGEEVHRVGSGRALSQECVSRWGEGHTALLAVNVPPTWKLSEAPASGGGVYGGCITWAWLMVTSMPSPSFFPRLWGQSCKFLTSNHSLVSLGTTPFQESTKCCPIRTTCVRVPQKTHPWGVRAPCQEPEADSKFQKHRWSHVTPSSLAVIQVCGALAMTWDKDQVHISDCVPVTLAVTCSDTSLSLCRWES